MIDKTYTPRARVKVLLTDLEQEVDISADLATLTTSKGYGKAAGGWSLTLPYKSIAVGGAMYHYKDLFQPDDVVSIEMDAGDGQGFVYVMKGLVNRASRRKTMAQDGTPQRSISVSGMDMGKLIMRHDCAWSISLQEKNLQNPELLRLERGLFFTGTPSKMITDMWNALFIQDVTAKAKYYALETHTDDDWMIYNYSVLHSTGPVWTAMKQCANEPWNILYTETADDGMFIVGLERLPFDDNGKIAREASRFHELSPAEIISEDLGIDDDDRVNYEYLQTYKTIIGLDDKIPIQNITDGIVNIDDKDVAAHGFRKKIVESAASFMGPEGNAANTSTEPQFLEAIQARSLAFWNRMRNNHLLESGTFKIHLSPRMRAGDAMLSEGNEYFIEQISHDMNFANERPTHTTVINVTRGQSHADTGIS